MGTDATKVSRLVRNKWYLLWPGEVEFLKELAISLPSSPVVVNIGAGKGTSGLAFMEARDDMQLYTVDIAQKNGAGDGLEAERIAFLAAGFPTSGQFCHQIHMPSDDAGYKWREEWGHMPLVDMVFIDGDHSYEAVKRDIHAWVPNVKEGGIIALHDYRNWEVTDYQGLYGPTRARGVVEGVNQAVTEIMDGVYIVIGRRDTIIAFRR